MKIERWSAEDIELLLGARVTWNSLSYWEAVSARETDEGWILILENEDGKTTTLSPGQMAKGPDVRGPRRSLFENGKLKPKAEWRADIYRNLRTLMLTMRTNYAATQTHQ